MPMLRPRSRRRTRAGLGLVEVLTALAVFGVGAAAVLHSVDVAQRTGGRARFLNDAVLRAKQIHGQLESGVVAASTSRRAFADDPRWSWSVAEVPIVDARLTRRTVTVAHSVAGSERTFALTRIVASDASTSTESEPNRGGR